MPAVLCSLPRAGRGGAGRGGAGRRWVGEERKGVKGARRGAGEPEGLCASKMAQIKFLFGDFYCLWQGTSKRSGKHFMT